MGTHLSPSATPPRTRSNTAALSWLGTAESEVLFLRNGARWPQGEPVPSVVQVTSGIVKLFRTWESRRRTLVGLAGPGTILG